MSPGHRLKDSIERGFRLRGPVDDEWGRSESLDPDRVGDIADEGTDTAVVAAAISEASAV